MNPIILHISNLKKKMNADTLQIIYSFTTIRELAICSQLSQVWKSAITWKHRQPFPFVKNLAEFKKLYQIPMIGAVIEISGNELIKDVNSIDQSIDYRLQRHWTCAPLGKAKRNPGVYISLDCDDIKSLQICFPEFHIQRSESKIKTKQYLLSSTSIPQKKLNKNDDPIFDTLECESEGTMQRNERNVYGYPFKLAWDFLNVKNHGYMQETKVHIDWEKYHYFSKINSWQAGHFHSFIIDYLLNRYCLFESAQSIQIKSITKVSKNRFLQLKFKDVLDYNRYAEIYNCRSRYRVKKIFPR
jgi:hypothetical protein